MRAPALVAGACGHLSSRASWGGFAACLGRAVTTSGPSPLLLVGCPSVHTLGMRYQLDVVLVDEGGLVLGSWRELPAGRVVRCAGARHALERPSCGEPWPVVGDRVELRNMWHVMGA